MIYTYIICIYLILAPGQVPAGGPGEMGCVVIDCGLIGSVIGGMLSGLSSQYNPVIYYIIEYIMYTQYIYIYLYQ